MIKSLKMRLKNQVVSSQLMIFFIEDIKLHKIIMIKNKRNNHSFKNILDAVLIQDLMRIKSLPAVNKTIVNLRENLFVDN